MPEIQKGTTTRPIIVKPRIAGVGVTQTQIKNDFSNEFISDGATPLSFVLEYKNRDATVPTSIAWDPAKSTETEIFFAMPDAFWIDTETWTVMVAWQIATEKNYVVENTIFTVKDLHRGI